jgi:hypothetical protein
MLRPLPGHVWLVIPASQGGGCNVAGPLVITGVTATRRGQVALEAAAVRDSLRVSFGRHTNSRMKVVAAEDGQIQVVR